MRALERIIAGVAPTDIPVLLVGESGAGKLVVATEIHRLSRQSDEPFIHISCATLTVAGLSEWSHNGHVANSNQPETMSSSGTLFLDEISMMELACQSRLLELLPSTSAFLNEPRPRFRVISATSRDLEEEMRGRRFREELYYRINGACLRLPPLRQRTEDIPLLVDYLLGRYSTEFGRPLPKLSSGTLNALRNYSWPGNIRELENVVRKIVVLGDEDAAIGDLASQAAPDASVRIESETRTSLKGAARAASQSVERELILKTLDRTHWNRKRASQELQISYKALLYKLKQLGLSNSGIS
jgi:DNA-binding NtrC family response regulator